MECVNYDGRRKRTITESATYPFGLALHDGILYWTDWERLALHCFCEVFDVFDVDKCIYIGLYIIIIIIIHKIVVVF